jgi:Cu/Ag efflux protein CusF
MTRWLTLSGGFVAIALLSAGLAYGQSKADCEKAAKATPQKVEAQVVKVDTKTNKVTVRDSKGMTHEFQASKETLQDLKPGDRIEANLREAPKC